MQNLIEAVQLRILVTGQRLNLGEFKLDEISAKFTADCAKKYIFQFGKSSSKQMFSSVYQ